jgi:hypothetical protein
MALINSTTRGDGFDIMAGKSRLEGSNPLTVKTGFNTLFSFTATLEGSAAPGVGTSLLTHTISGGDVSVYAWKVTGSGDATLIASTGTETFSWTACGK